MNHVLRCLVAAGLLSFGLSVSVSTLEAQGRLSYPQSKAFRRVKQTLGDLRSKYTRSFGAVDAAGTKAADLSSSQRARLAASADELEALIADVAKTVASASLPKKHPEVAPVLEEVAAFEAKVTTWRAALAGSPATPAGAPTPKTPTGPPAKLSYPQRKALKRMQGRVKDLEGKSSRQLAAYEGSGGSQGTFDEGQIATFRSQIAALRELVRQNNADAKGASLVAGHPEVKPVFAAMAVVEGKVDVWEKGLPAAGAKPAAGTAPKGSPGAAAAPKKPDDKPGGGATGAPAPLTRRQKDQLERLDKGYVQDFVRAYHGARKNIDLIMKSVEGRVVSAGTWTLVDSYFDPLEQKQKNLDAAIARENLPKSHPEVGAVLKKVEDLKAEVAALKADIARRKGGAIKAADLSNYPDHKKDFARAEATAALYAKVSVSKWYQVFESAFRAKLKKDFPHVNTGVTEHSYDGPDPVSLLSRVEADKKDLSGLFKKYKDYIGAAGASNNPLYRVLVKAGQDIKRYIESVNEFVASHSKKQYKHWADQLRAQLAKKDLDDAELDRSIGALRDWRRDIAYDQARADFQAGMVARFKPIDPKGMEAFVAKATKLSSDLEEFMPVAAKRLLALRVPPSKEYYKGADLEEFRAEAKRLWAASYPAEPLVKLVFRVEKFERKVTKTWDEASKSWDLSDMSYLQFAIIARQKDSIPGAPGPVAMVSMGIVNRDNLANTTSIGIHDRGRSYSWFEVLLSKVK